jgi:hypothetical protein
MHMGLQYLQSPIIWYTGGSPGAVILFVRNTYYHVSFPGLTLDVYVQVFQLRQHRRNYTDEQINDLMDEFADAPAPLPEDDVRKEVHKVVAQGYYLCFALCFLLPVCSLFLC